MIEAGGNPAPASTLPGDGAGALSRCAQALLRVTEAAFSHLGVDELLHGLLERVAAELDVDVSAVLLRDERGDALVVRASKGLESDVQERTRVPLGDGFAGRVATERCPILLSPPGAGDLFSSHLCAKGLQALLGVPLVVGGDVTGVLLVGSVHPRRFSGDDIALLELVAARAALAVENAALFEREHHIAETLQRSLLPTELPQVRGLEACARYVPGSPGTTVGGDWYDLIPLACGGVGLVIGDVAGRGTRAAAVMGLARNALRAYALEGHAPARAVALLDRLLQATEPGEMVTLAYLVIDVDRTTMTVTNAGHPPPFVSSAEGGAFIAGSPSVALGVVPDAARHETVVRLTPGSRVVLYTDGLIERRGACLDRGLAALREAVESAPDELDQLCDHLLDTMIGVEGLGDDAAVLGVRRSPLAPTT